MALVHTIAHRVRRQTGRSTIEVDDLVGYGSKGLLEAAERFNSEEGASFTTFAYYRIRGAMLDGIRTMGWYSRADRARYRAEERANELLQNLSEREAVARASGQPSRSEVATTLQEVSDVLAQVSAVHITSLEAAADVADDKLVPADASLELGQMSTKVRVAVGQLPDKERALLELFYFGDKNLTEAGQALGLSKSWACRLHTRAVGLLRVALEDAPPPA